MKFFLIQLMILAFFVTSEAEEKIAAVGNVFVDNGTFELALVRYGDESSNTYLAKITGVDSPLNEKIFKLKTNGGGTSATYYTNEDGKNVLRAPAHDFFGWEAYVSGKTYKINLDKEASKKLKTAEILEQYLLKSK